VYEIIIIIFLLIISLLVYTKITAQKKINKALNSVSKENPVYINISLSDIIVFCHKKYIKFYKVDDILVITYQHKSIYVRTSTDENSGDSKFYII
jgi:hypothetical protein